MRKRRDHVRTRPLWIDGENTHTFSRWSGTGATGEVIHVLPGPVSPALAYMNARLKNRSANQTPQSVMSNTSLRQDTVCISLATREKSIQTLPLRTEELRDVATRRGVTSRRRTPSAQVNGRRPRRLSDRGRDVTSLRSKQWGQLPDANGRGQPLTDQNQMLTVG